MNGSMKKRKQGSPNDEKNDSNTTSPTDGRMTQRQHNDTSSSSSLSEEF